MVFDESFGRVRPSSCNQWFYNFGSLTNIEGLHNLSTPEVTTMASMFENCNSLKEILVGFFDTSNVTDMNSMFYGCTALEQLNLYEWETQQVTDRRICSVIVTTCAN